MPGDRAPVPPPLTAPVFQILLSLVDENLHGYAEIKAYRAARPPAGLARELERTVITAYGRDMATANTLFRRGGRLGRQSQTWARMPEGWRVVSAHVSMMP